MRYTRIFFSTVFDLIAILISLWLVVLIAMLATFVLYFFTGYIINPWLPIGLIVIHGLFRKDGAIERAIEENEQENKF